MVSVISFNPALNSSSVAVGLATNSTQNTAKRGISLRQPPLSANPFSKPLSILNLWFGEHVVCKMDSRGFRHFRGFRDFRESSTQLLACSCLSCLRRFRRFRDIRRFRESQKGA